MTIFTDLFGQKKLREGKEYCYDALSQELRTTIYAIIYENASHYTWESIKPEDDVPILWGLIAKNSGKIGRTSDPHYSLAEWIRTCSFIEYMQMIEMFLYLKKIDQSHMYLDRLHNTIHEINMSFSNHRIGYEIMETSAGFRIVRRDSEYLHEEVVKPALNLLHSHSFKGASVEFEKALQRYYNGDLPGAIQEAGNAFESTMKDIFDRLKIRYDKDARANQLIPLLQTNDLIKGHSLDFTTHLTAILFGLPTIRNNEGGHGAGATPRKNERSYAQLAMHLCASFIVFLIQRYEERAKK